MSLAMPQFGEPCGVSSSTGRRCPRAQRSLGGTGTIAWAPTATGHGPVYRLEDGFGMKVGYTDGPVAKRVAGLQTGNSRKITSIAEILGATLETEGCWREPVIVQAGSAGGLACAPSPQVLVEGHWLLTD